MTEQWPDPTSLREAVESALQDAQATYGSLDHMPKPGPRGFECHQSDALEDLNRCIKRLHQAVAFLDEAPSLNETDFDAPLNLQPKRRRRAVLTFVDKELGK